MFAENIVPMNPFFLTPHTPNPYFCDRETETEAIVNYLENGSNVALISPRRYGKTGLIYHVFDMFQAKKAKVELYYVDIYSSRNADDFITLLAEAISRTLKKESAIKTFFKSLGRLRPVLSQDPLSGNPQLSFTFQTDTDRRYSLKALLDFLERRPHKVILAIDEFQQVREYEEVSMEALLRTYIQPLKNVQFIFSGSKKHMIAEMFTAEKAPFYESASIYSIDKIDHQVYTEFIDRQFKAQKKSITPEATDFILEWTRRHTYYTQMLCNRVFQSVRKEAALVDVLIAADTLLKEHTDTFLERRNYLTARQWNYLIAIAKEGIVTEPTSATFLQKYHLGAPSTVSRLLNSLLEKELLLELRTMNGNSYCVYNVFFSRWLERM